MNEGQQVLAAIRLQNLTESDTDDWIHDSARRSADAVLAFLNDTSFWENLRQDNAADSDSDSEAEDGWRRRTAAKELLTDKLCDVMVKSGYRPPPEAMDLVSYPEKLIREAGRQDLPTATREDLVGGCRAGLIELYKRLCELPILRTDPDSASRNEPSRIDVDASRRVLTRGKAVMVSAVVLIEVTNEEGNGTREQVRREAREWALRFVFKSLLDCQP